MFNVFTGSAKTFWHIACRQDGRFQMEGGPQMQRVILPLLVALWLPLTAAPAAGPPKPGPRSDLEKMQGTWRLVRLVAGGEVQEVPSGEGTMVIKGTHLQWPAP